MFSITTCGVFADRQAALACIARIPDNSPAQHELLHIGVESFPVFLFEDAEGFSFRAPADANADVERLAAITHADEADEDHVYANLYRFDAPWQPTLPGTDYMGGVPHVHVEKRHLKRIRERGLDSLWA